MVDKTPDQSSLPTPPFPISEMEAECYYAGRPSKLRLVARTGNTPWKPPTGPEAHTTYKKLFPVGNHAIGDVWNDGLPLKVSKLLDAMEVKFTSIDLVRIGNPEEYLPPVILWIGVIPKSLSSDHGFVVATQCRRILEEHNITDVEVEIRESVVWPSFDI